MRDDTLDVDILFLGRGPEFQEDEFAGAVMERTVSLIFHFFFQLL